MKEKDLIPIKRLVDVKTTKIVGYIIKNTVNSVALTVDKMKELNLDCVSWCDYDESIINLDVVIKDNKYSDTAFALTYLQEYEDVPYERMSDGNIIIYGYVINSNRLIELDNEVAIKNCIIDSER